MSLYPANTDNLRDYLFSDVIADCCLKHMQAHCATPEDIARGIKDLPSLIFINPSEKRNIYDNMDNEAYYLCKYGMAYAFEYVMYYDILLHMFKGEDMLILSFGCGSNLDAWSAAYALVKRRLENIAVKTIHYEGVDKLRWPFFIIDPIRGSYAHIKSPVLGDKINKDIIIRNFYVADFVKTDISDFAVHVKQSVNQSHALVADVMIFPMILNELSSADVDAFTRSLDSLTFNRQTYYIVGAYSNTKFKEDVNKMNKIVTVFKKHGYQAEYNLNVLLNGDPTDIMTSYSIKPAVTLGQCDLSTFPQVYMVGGSIESSGDGFHKFSDDSPLLTVKKYLDKLTDTAEIYKNPIISNARRARMMTKAQFKFQIIRLSKPQHLLFTDIQHI